METLSKFFDQHLGLFLLFALGLAFLYAGTSLWLWNRKKDSSGNKSSVTPSWVSDLPAVYSAANVHSGHTYWIWCPETQQEQSFRVLQISNGWFYVRVHSGFDVYEGWALEIRSDTHLHPGHLHPQIPRTAVPA